MELLTKDAFPAEAFAEESIAVCVLSLTDISSVFEVSGSGSEIEARAAAAAQQNQDAQACAGSQTGIRGSRGRPGYQNE